MTGGGAKELELLAELHADPLDRLLNQVQELRRSEAELQGHISDLLMHLRQRLECARDSLLQGDPQTALSVIVGEIRALEQSFLAGGGGGVQ